MCLGCPFVMSTNLLVDILEARYDDEDGIGQHVVSDTTPDLVFPCQKPSRPHPTYQRYTSRPPISRHPKRHMSDPGSTGPFAAASLVAGTRSRPSGWGSCVAPLLECHSAGHPPCLDRRPITHGSLAHTQVAAWMHAWQFSVHLGGGEGAVHSSVLVKFRCPRQHRPRSGKGAPNWPHGCGCGCVRGFWVPAAGMQGT
jgi:hypothetical protein